MPVSALLSELFPAALLRGPVARAPAPSATTPPGIATPDVVVFSSAPLRLLSELASAGLRQLATLLPALETAIAQKSSLPIGHLARAAASAARQVAEGHVALLAEGPDRIEAALNGELHARAAAPGQAPQLLRTLAREIGATPNPADDARPSDSLRTITNLLGEAEPGPGPASEPSSQTPAHRWLDEAQRLLRHTDDALDQAGLQLRAASADPRTVPAEATWALREITAAQAQLAGAVTRLGAAPQPVSSRSRTAWTLPAILDDLHHGSSATAAIGLLFLILTAWLAEGAWFLSSLLAGIAATIYWAVRFGRAARSIRLDVRR